MIVVQIPAYQNPTFLGMFQRVENQILDDTQQVHRIALNGHLRRPLTFQRQSLLIGQGLIAGHKAGQQLPGIDLLDVQYFLPGFETGQIHQLNYKIPAITQVTLENFEQLFALIIRFSHHLKQCRSAQQHPETAPQIM